MPQPAATQSDIRREWPAYPRAGDAALATLCDDVRVAGVTAILHRCLPHWSIRERRIGDDMFFLVLAGRGECTVAGRRHALGPGDCAHFLHGIAHAARHDPRRPLTVAAVHYTATVAGALSLPELIDLPEVTAMDAATQRVLEEACREYALRPPGWERGLEAAVLRVLLDLARVHGPRSPLGPSAALRRLAPALTAMRSDPAAPLAMPVLARRCQVSAAQFRRLFRLAVGRSPVQHLRRIRLEEACRLLRHSGLGIPEIARAVGYADPSFFARTFKSFTGSSPGRWRALPQP